MLMNRRIKIIHSFLILLVDNQLVMFLRNILFFQVFFNIITCLIRRAIININYSVIVVILHENWVKISQVKSTFDVIIRGCNDTERKFVLTVIVDVIFLIVVLFVLSYYFLDPFVLLLSWIFVGSQLNNNFSSKPDVMYDFCEFNGLNVHIFWDFLNLKVILRSVRTEISILNDRLNGAIKKILVLVSLDIGKEL